MLRKRFPLTRITLPYVHLYLGKHHPRRMAFPFYNCGNNKENLFKETRNYEYFLQLLKKYISPIADILAYCILPNHYHLLIQVKNQDEISEDLLDKKKLSRQFGTCFGTYTKAINKAYSRTGKLFESRFKRVIVTTDQQYF